MSRYWSKNLNNSPVGGYEQTPQYVSERGNKPEPVDFEYAVNRRQRRMAEKAIRQYAASDQTAEKASPERRLGSGELPIADMRHEIVDSIANNQVTIITAETGAGKSTQVMQYILDDLDRDVALTQPRRIAARNISQRIEDEVANAWPEQEGLIGYHTAEVNTVTDATRGVVCTDGLRYVKQLHDDGSLASEVLCIDEVHEWNTNIEMLVAWTRELLKTNPEMRVVLMSATMDAEEIANFYADVTDTMPPIIKVPGRTYPVDKHEMPTSTVVEVVTSDMAKGKNILCFLPGKREIKDAIKQTRQRLQKEGGGVLPEMLALHSRMSEKEQDRAFKSYPNNKIVFATDVAQTSLTIDDIDMVVDSGLVRENQIDDEGTESLSLIEISQDSSDQRAGRAGRVKEGTYVLTRLNKDIDFMSYINREKHSVPEIYRTDVDRNTLHFAAAGLDIANIKLLHSLKKEPLERSKRSLRLLGALDDSDTITAMGRKMEKLSLHPMFARMVIESEQYSVATRAQVMAIAAACDTGGLRYYGPETEKRWKPIVQEADSDAIAELELFMAARDMSSWEQQQHDLDVNNVNRATEQYEKMMRNASLDVDVISAPTQQERENIKRCIYAGMIDHIYEYAGSDEYVRISGESQTRREISNRSVVKGRPALVAATPYRVEFYQSGDKVERHIVENVTKVSTPHILAEVALHLCDWETDTQTLRGGQLMDVQALSFRGVTTGVTREVPATVDEQSHEFMVEHIMNSPGNALRDLYAVESEIKQLRKLSSNAPRSIHDTIKSIVKEAVSLGGLDESYVDYLIRQRNISLYDYISQEKIEEIYNNSPLSVSSYGHDFKLVYESGVPLIKKYDAEVVKALPDEVRLEDGRVAKFVGAHGRHLTVDMLRRQ